MGSELIIRRWCDRCRGEEGEGFRADQRVTIPGDLDRLLDLCGDCFEALLGPVIEALGDLGEDGKAAAKAATKVAPKAAQPMLPNGRAARTPPDPSDRQQCEFCPSQPSSLNAYKQHMRVRHGLLWGDYQAGRPPIRGAQGAVA